MNLIIDKNDLGQGVPAIRLLNFKGNEHMQDLKLEIPDHWDSAAECHNMPKTPQPALAHFSAFEVF